MSLFCRDLLIDTGNILYKINKLTKQIELQNIKLHDD